MSRVSSGVIQSIRPALVTSTAHACLGDGGPQVPCTGVTRAGVPATLPQATRDSVEQAASNRRAVPNLMTMGRSPARARCTAAVSG